MPGEAFGQMPRPRRGIHPRATLFISIALAVVWAVGELDLGIRELVPARGGLAVLQEFFGRALRPALSYESEIVPDGASPLLVKALAAAHETLVLATAAMSLAVVLGLPLGVVTSTTWWRRDSTRRWQRRSRLFTAIASSVYGVSRITVALLRSVHELLWAVLFLCALGITPLSAVLAIAIPFAGVLAKVFSEILDEASQESALALEASGASRLQAFVFALLPRALPDMGAYTFYRFECAVRSSAVLGFFGFPTLGYFIAASFENLHYGEVWTYLYTLFALVILTDSWSGALRQRWVAR